MPQDRIRKYTDENIELSRTLKRDSDAMRAQLEKPKKTPGSTRKGGRGAGSEFSSNRGSEERQTSVQAAGTRGQKRGRDYDIEKVSESFSLFS